MPHYKGVSLCFPNIFRSAVPEFSGLEQVKAAFPISLFGDEWISNCLAGENLEIIQDCLRPFFGVMVSQGRSFGHIPEMEAGCLDSEVKAHINNPEAFN